MTPEYNVWVNEWLFSIILTSINDLWALLACHSRPYIHKKHNCVLFSHHKGNIISCSVAYVLHNTTMVYRWFYTYSPIFCIEFVSKLSRQSLSPSTDHNFASSLSVNCHDSYFHRLPTISSTYLKIALVHVCPTSQGLVLPPPPTYLHALLRQVSIDYCSTRICKEVIARIIWIHINTFMRKLLYG